MKNNFIKILKSKYPEIKKKGIKPNSDLLKDAVFDSLEILKFLSYLEKKHKFNTRKYLKKNKKFTIQLIEKELR